MATVWVGEKIKLEPAKISHISSPTSQNSVGYLLNFNTSERPFLKILLLTTFPLRSFFCSS